MAGVTSGASTRSKVAERVAVALDGMPLEEAERLAEGLAGQVWGFKVNDLLQQKGALAVQRLRRWGRVFADPKLHDIPNTVANSLRPLIDAGADLVTVHASGGRAMLDMALAVAGPTRLAAVTALTSLDDAECRAVYGESSAQVVMRLAAMAADSGLEQVVCSPLELRLLQKQDDTAVLRKIVPGIRLQPAAADDQQRTQSPRQALSQGAYLLVVGRPITQAADPLAALRALDST